MSKSFDWGTFYPGEQKKYGRSNSNYRKLGEIYRDDMEGFCIREILVESIADQTMTRKELLEYAMKRIPDEQKAIKESESILQDAEQLRMKTKGHQNGKS